MTFFSELRRRNVFRVGAAYAVVGWVLIEVADVLLPTFDAPSWVLRVLILFLAIGFVVAVVLAWIYELTPEGVRTTLASDSAVAAPSVSRNRFSDLVLAVVVIAVGYLMLDQFVLDGQPSLSDTAVTAASFPGEPYRLSLKLPEGTWLAVDRAQPALALSPDGQRIAFLAYGDGVRRLYIRELAATEASIVNGSEGAVMPFFSADGESLAFVVGSYYRIVPARGGVPVTGRSTTGGDVNRGTTWLGGDLAVHAMSSNGSLLVGSVRDDNMRESFGGPDNAYIWPAALPGNDAVLFADNSYGAMDEAVISRIDLASGTITDLVRGGTNPRYSRSGHILFGSEGRLYAVRYDPDSSDADSDRTPLIDGVLTNSAGAVEFSVAQNGTLAYVPGGIEQKEIVFVDRNGNASLLYSDVGRFEFPRLSPDGGRLAITRPTGAAMDIWTLDLTRNNLLERWTDDFGEDFAASWSPDGQIAFASEIGEVLGDGGPLLAVMGGPMRTASALTLDATNSDSQLPTDWSPDGRYILYTHTTRNAILDIHTYDLLTGATAPYIATAATETAARFSPDGSHVAYTSDASGSLEVYVDAFPEPTGAIKISNGGGDEPVWSRDGRELFYRNGNELFRVAIREGPGFERAAPELLFIGDYLLAEGDDSPQYEVSADGQSFYMIRDKNPLRPATIEIVLNWPVALGLE